MKLKSCNIYFGILNLYQNQENMILINFYKKALLILQTKNYKHNHINLLIHSNGVTLTQTIKTSYLKYILFQLKTTQVIIIIIEDDSATFRFDYSMDFLKWMLTPPGQFPDWLVTVKIKKTGKIVGLITAIPMHVNVDGKIV